MKFVSAAVRLANSLQGPDVASRHRPLDFQIIPAGKKKKDKKRGFFLATATKKHVVNDGGGEGAEPRSDSLFVALDEELQVELVHGVEDVVAVRPHHVLVVVDLLLSGRRTKTKNKRKKTRGCQ